MQNKLLKNPVYRNSDGYNSNGFEQRVSFSSSIGQLLPVYYDLLSPGDKITIADRMETRTITLNSSVWTDLVDTIDYFFVPLDQIYSLFGSFFYGVDDRKTSFVNEKTAISHYMPTFDLFFVLRQMADSLSSDQVGESVANGFWRLLDCFGISSTQLSKMYLNYLDDEKVSEDYLSHPLTPIFFAAYQKVWRDYYRLDDFSPNDPDSYNLDRYYANTGLIQFNASVNGGMFMLRHRPWQKDFFKNVFRSPLIPAGWSDTSESSTSLINSEFMGSVNQWLSGRSDFLAVDPAPGDALSGNGDSTVSLSPKDAPAQISAPLRQINTANLRSMFALDKLLEVTRRAGKTYDLQTLAHFGIKTDDFDSDRVFYLGTHESPILVRDVVATADGSVDSADTSIVGDVSGKGYGAKRSDPRDDIRFTARKHGVLLAIYSCVPKADYSQLGYDPLHHLMERTDFPIPEFANLGMQPLFAYYANLGGFQKVATDNSTQINEDNDVTDWSAFDVWQYRYSQFKYKFNRVFGALQHSERKWKPQQILLGEYLDSLEYNMLIDPTFLNGIVVKDYITSNIFNPYVSDKTKDPNLFISELYESDPLHHEFVFDVVKTSKISNYGLPQL